MRARAALLLAAVLAAACTIPGGGSTTSDPGTGETPSTISMPGGQAVVVIAVLDGDSLEAEVGGTAEEIRLLGINSPEREECWSEEARSAAERMLETDPVTLTVIGRDRFGRILGYVAAAGNMVNARLLAEGHAIAVSADHGHLDEFLALDDAAHAARLGLWAADACGPRAEGPAVIADIDADPAGPDGDPEAGESAGVTNPGDAGVDLSGWMLRDESSVHRYVFPPGTILGPGETIRVFSVCGHHPHCFGTEPVWSNGGDTGLLLDPRGNVADRLRYRG